MDVAVVDGESLKARGWFAVCFSGEASLLRKGGLGLCAWFGSFDLAPFFPCTDIADMGRSLVIVSAFHPLMNLGLLMR